MPFDEFLDLVKVLRMLYGVQIARDFFEKNIDLYYNLNSQSITKTQENN